LKYQYIFPSPQYMVKTKDWFDLYCEICQHSFGKADRAYAVLLSQSSSDSTIFLAPYVLHHTLAQRIELLLEASHLWGDIMRRHSKDFGPVFSQPDNANYRERWTWMLSTKTAINNAKSKQLRLAADLLETEAGRKILKRTLNPSQSCPRQNTTHIVERLREDAEKVLNDRIAIGRYHAKYHWATPHPPLVPYDRYVRFFFHTIQKYPPVTGLSGWTETRSRVCSSSPMAKYDPRIYESTKSQDKFGQSPTSTQRYACRHYGCAPRSE